MLVLSRHRDESIHVTHEPTGERFMLQVVEIRGDKVRLGFEAGSNFTIHRTEVQEAIDRSQGGKNEETTPSRT